MKENRHIGLKVAFAGLMLVFSLLAIMTIFIFWTNPLLLGAPGILSDVIGVFITSGLVYLVLAAIVSLTVLVMIKTAPEIKNSVLIKDNTLRYERTDENNRKQKRSFQLTKINEYLLSRKSIETIDDIRLYRQDSRKPLSAKTLMAELPDKRKMSLRQLSQEDPELYNRICRFLERIADKDDIHLDFRLRSYVNQENLIEKGNKAREQIRRSADVTRDLSIRQGVAKIIDNIIEASSRIDEVRDTDKLRKLYDNYLKIYNDILLNYNNIETHQVDEEEINKARDQILELAEVINKSFETLYVENRDSQLEASISNLEQINEESRQLLEQSKQLDRR